MDRLSGMNDPYTNVSYVGSVAYGPANELLQLNASAFTETRSYNANLELTELTSGANVHYRYNYSATQDNGQLQSQTDVLSGEVITYRYDTLRRLASANGQGDPSGAWSQTYGYDGFGNLTQKTASNAPALSVAVDPTTNRLQTNAAYDADGNLTAYAGDQYRYDLQNRLTQANPASGGTVLYGYDSTNHRVYQGRYANGTYSNEQLYFYGVEGHLYRTWQINPSSGVLLQATVTKQWFGNRLLSPQDRLDSRGKYYPYGEERTGLTPPNPPNDQEKFASYTRDSATGLDYADQRYYDNLIGRFTKPDPFGGSANPMDPQSWNRYAYVGDDPANGFDPNGLDDPYSEYLIGTGGVPDFANGGSVGSPIPVACPGCTTTVYGTPDPIDPIGSVTYVYPSGDGGGSPTLGGGGGSASPVINLQNISKSGPQETVILNTLKDILAYLDDKCASFFGGRVAFTSSINSFLSTSGSPLIAHGSFTPSTIAAITGGTASQIGGIGLLQAESQVGTFATLVNDSGAFFSASYTVDNGTLEAIS